MPPKYGTRKRVEDVTKQLRNVEKTQADPYLYGSIANKNEFQQQKAKILAEKEAITPPPDKDDAERKSLDERRDKIREFIVNACPEIKKPAMPSEKDQWERKAGAVGYHRAHSYGIHHYNLDKSGRPVRSTYSASDEYKDICRRLDGDQEEFDPDVASLEKLRPATSHHSSASDYVKMVYAPGARIDEEQYAKAVEGAPEVTCKGVKANGDKCGNIKMTGSDYCRHHGKEEMQATA